MFRLFTKPWSGVVLPIIRKKFAPLVVDEFDSVQPIVVPSGTIVYADFKKCQEMFGLYEELWLEDGEDGELWCPQIEDDCFVDEHTFRKIRWKELVFEDWEIEQLNTYVEGIGNQQKQLIGTGFKAMWFPEK